MEKELKAQVQQMVDELFSEKEEVKIREKTEATLKKSAETISELTLTLEEKTAEASDLEVKLSDSEAKIQELETELEAAGKELETSKEQIVKVEKEIEDMKKDRAAEQRMAELEDAGVAHSDRETQTVKVKEMTDEDFASYRDELVSIREAVVAELEKAREEKAEADAKAEEKAAEEAEEKKEEKADEEKAEEKEEAEEEKAEEEAEEKAAEEKKEEDTTAPAEITPGQAAMASLNMEYIPSPDLVDKYKKLGEAMAKMWKKED